MSSRSINYEEYYTKSLIIGSGPAGHSAAIYAARSGLEPIVVSGEQPGGQLTITTDVENYPGFEKAVQGPFLMEQMQKQSERSGATIMNDMIKTVILDKYPFTAIGDKNIYKASSIIIATGAQAKWLGLESEKKFMGFGVSGCATCDGFFYKNKIVLVVGGGNTAVEEALYLSKLASKVILVHRRNTLRAEKVLQRRLLSNSKINVIWNAIISEVLGTENPMSVNGVRIEDVNTRQKKKIVVDGIFIAIGHSPKTDLFQGKLHMDEEGYIVTKPGSTKTNIPGIFAAGDVQDKIYRQAITAAGTGCMAALEASKFIEEHQSLI